MSRHLAQKSVTDLLRDNCGCITQENNETGSDYFTFADNFGSICGNSSTGNCSMISLKESQTAEIFRRRPFMGLFLITHCWFCIFATIMIVGFLPNVLTIFLGILIIGSRQQALLVLMHEAAHGNLFEHKFFNYWAAQLLCAYPVFADTKVYRSYHAKHHAWTQTKKDPDLVLTSGYPITKNSMIRKILRDMLGITGVRQFYNRFSEAFEDKESRLSTKLKILFRVIGPGLLVNILFLALLVHFGYGWIFYSLWLVPLLTWHQVVLRIRNVSEHGALVSYLSTELGVARTTLTSLFGRFFIAPYWVNYHLEHHLFPSVPCYNLPIVHRLLKEQGYSSQSNLEEGYHSVLKKITHSNYEKPLKVRKTRLVGSFTKGYKEVEI